MSELLALAATTRSAINQCVLIARLGGDGMATRAEREMLKNAYPNKKWADKVDKMSDSQVIAVFRRLQSQNKL
jgi:hypothetical protein